ncbi:sperm flagellar protein 1-like [Pectinophora gossypiella]|uniref:sperm flagellar protein 1-like n=1 Tax=Pectinophora gossypiella TaxID=13191 RepID=UPI00214E4D38|nr:sperm flagellar protein 1-like [Pectinophora gossypiella]
MSASAFGSPIPLSEIESVLAWVDTFKLSRPTKKINRDFSDAVLLAEILAMHYPKLVEMHNYPPRNSHALKLNNWMTLNRKVLKKLKLNLCCNTMEQLANSTTGVIERVLVMVRDKIKRDEELEKSTKDAEQNVSSGGSYYEACGDDEHVLVVPVKMRVNGTLETVQQKVVSHDAYLTLKEELKDAKDTAELLKQKVEHLDNLIKLKDERITELQKQLDRKQLRRKEPEVIPNCISVPFDDLPSPILDSFNPSANKLIEPVKVPSIPKLEEKTSKTSLPVPTPKIPSKAPTPKTSITEVTSSNIRGLEEKIEVEVVSSNIFKDIELLTEEKSPEDEEFKDSEPGNIITIQDTIEKEIIDLSTPEVMNELHEVMLLENPMKKDNLMNMDNSAY